MAFGLQASRRHSHPRPCCPPLRSCVSRCTRVSHTWCCWRRLAGATTYWSSSGGQLGSSTSVAPPSFGCLGGYQALRHPRVRIVQAPSGTAVMCHPQVHTTRWHTASSFHVNTRQIQKKITLGPPAHGRPLWCPGGALRRRGRMYGAPRPDLGATRRDSCGDFWGLELTRFVCAQPSVWAAPWTSGWLEMDSRHPSQLFRRTAPGGLA